MKCEYRASKRDSFLSVMDDKEWFSGNGLHAGSDSEEEHSNENGVTPADKGKGESWFPTSASDFCSPEQKTRKKKGESRNNRQLTTRNRIDTTFSNDFCSEHESEAESTTHEAPTREEISRTFSNDFFSEHESEAESMHEKKPRSKRNRSNKRETDRAHSDVIDDGNSQPSEFESASETDYEALPDTEKRRLSKHERKRGRRLSKVCAKIEAGWGSGTEIDSPQREKEKKSRRAEYNRRKEKQAFERGDAEHKKRRTSPQRSETEACKSQQKTRGARKTQALEEPSSNREDQSRRHHQSSAGKSRRSPQRSRDSRKTEAPEEPSSDRGDRNTRNRRSSPEKSHRSSPRTAARKIGASEESSSDREDGRNRRRRSPGKSDCKNERRERKASPQRLPIAAKIGIFEEGISDLVKFASRKKEFSREGSRRRMSAEDSEGSSGRKATKRSTSLRELSREEGNTIGASTRGEGMNQRRSSSMRGLSRNGSHRSLTSATSDKASASDTEGDFSPGKVASNRSSLLGNDEAELTDDEFDLDLEPEKTPKKSEKSVVKPFSLKDLPRRRTTGSMYSACTTNAVVSDVEYANEPTGQNASSGLFRDHDDDDDVELTELDSESDLEASATIFAASHTSLQNLPDRGGRGSMYTVSTNDAVCGSTTRRSTRSRSPTKSAIVRSSNRDDEKINSSDEDLDRSSRHRRTTRNRSNNTSLRRQADKKDCKKGSSRGSSPAKSKQKESSGIPNIESDRDRKSGDRDNKATSQRESIGKDERRALSRSRSPTQASPKESPVVVDETRKTDSCKHSILPHRPLQKQPKFRMVRTDSIRKNLVKTDSIRKNLEASTLVDTLNDVHPKNRRSTMQHIAYFEKGGNDFKKIEPQHKRDFSMRASARNLCLNSNDDLVGSQSLHARSASIRNLFEHSANETEGSKIGERRATMQHTAFPDMEKKGRRRRTTMHHCTDVLVDDENEKKHDRRNSKSPSKRASSRKLDDNGARRNDRISARSTWREKEKLRALGKTEVDKNFLTKDLAAPKENRRRGTTRSMSHGTNMPMGARDKIQRSHSIGRMDVLLEAEDGEDKLPDQRRSRSCQRERPGAVVEDCGPATVLGRIKQLEDGQKCYLPTALGDEANRCAQGRRGSALKRLLLTTESADRLAAQPLSSASVPDVSLRTKIPADKSTVTMPGDECYSAQRKDNAVEDILKSRRLRGVESGSRSRPATKAKEPEAKKKSIIDAFTKRS